MAFKDNYVKISAITYNTSRGKECCFVPEGIGNDLIVPATQADTVRTTQIHKSASMGRYRIPD